MRKVIILLLLWWLSPPAMAQDDGTWQQLVLSVMNEDDENDSDWEELLTELQEWADTPRDINTMTRDDWEALPFLTALQIEQLVEYHDRYGAMKSMNELLMLTALDEPRRQLIRRFCYIGDEPPRGFPLWTDVARYGRHELMAYTRIPTYERQGDKNGYGGYPVKHWLRYLFTYNDFVKAGIVGSQDAGEPLFAKPNTLGYDYYSFYCQLSHLGRLKTAVIGKYKLSAGMGLVLNNGFSLGKLATMTQTRLNTKILKAHSSRSADYQQGLAATVSLSQRMEATAFVSYRPMDATLNDDGSIRTLLTDGYHRTASEQAKKNNSHSAETGAHLTFHAGRLHLGATAVYSYLDRRLQPPQTALYRRHDATGHHLVNTSVDYSYQNRRLTVNGETAINGRGAVATLNSATALLTEGLTINAIQRFYSYRYTALHAHAFSNGGKVQNESGLLVGLSWTPSPRWQLTVYSDYSHAPWARYRITGPSDEWDHLAQLTYRRNAWSAGGRYRLRRRQRDITGSTTLENYTEQRGRLWMTWQQGAWMTKSQVDGTHVSGTDGGLMVSQTVAYERGSLRLSGGAGFFHTDGYDCRIYLYEAGPLYTFGISQFSGRGWRGWLMARWQPFRQLLLTAKAATTKYLDRDVISTGLQQVNASGMTDIELQMRWKW